MYTKQEIIIRYLREGKSQRQISRELQINRKTVKKYVDSYNSKQKREPEEKEISTDIYRSH
jgi:DNA-binding NarL/FixJ family response regulator